MIFDSLTIVIDRSKYSEPMESVYRFAEVTVPPVDDKTKTAKVLVLVDDTAPLYVEATRTFEEVRALCSRY